MFVCLWKGEYWRIGKQKLQSLYCILPEYRQCSILYWLILANVLLRGVATRLKFGTKKRNTLYNPRKNRIPVCYDGCFNSKIAAVVMFVATNRLRPIMCK